MQLHYDKSLHFNGPGFPSFIGETRGCSAPHALPIEDERSLDGIPNPKYVLRQGDYNIRLAISPERRSLVSKLIKNMYSWRGYHTADTVIPSHKAHQITLEASIEQHVVGTLTIGRDSEEGLLVDALYEQEIRTLRAENRKVCELSKLAIDPLHSSKELLASLFNLAYIYGRIVHRATDFVIEVNPRHTGYYKRILGFRQIGEMRTCQRVNAPAMLLHLELDYVDAQVSSLAGSRDPKQRSLYAYFLTKHEEQRVACSLRDTLRRRIN